MDSSSKPVAGRDRRIGIDWARWLISPRSAVFVFLALVLGLGGWRRFALARKARALADRIGGAQADAEEIEQASRFGRASLIELFQTLELPENDPRRTAAGRALARIWADDELVPEEEKAIVRRGYCVRWNARKRYPRALTRTIPLQVSYSVPFLSTKGNGNGVTQSSLLWSHRVKGSQRASLEAWSDWKAGPVRLEIPIEPSDFATDGPHTLVLESKVRTEGLTDQWELALPLVKSQFEFDPRLEPTALFALADSGRAQRVALGVELLSARPTELESAREPIPAGDWVISEPPVLKVSRDLPCDLAHLMMVEFEGVSGLYPCGQVIVPLRAAGNASDDAAALVDLGPITGFPMGLFDRPGSVRLHLILQPDAELGWNDPEIRSVWPESITTNWQTVQLMRR